MRNQNDRLQAQPHSWRDAFTANLYDRSSHLLVQHSCILWDAVRIVKPKEPFHIDAWVVLPGHLHCMWTLPEDDLDFSTRWQAIKVAFSRKIPFLFWRSLSSVTAQVMEFEERWASLHSAHPC
jgi:REP element-mobilizing transposase RayT